MPNTTFQTLKWGILTGICCCAFPLLAQNKVKSKENAALHKVLREGKQEQYAMLVRGNIPEIRQWISENGGSLLYTKKDIASVRIPSSKVNAFLALPGLKKADITHSRLQIMDDSSLSKNNALPVHAGQNPLDTSYTGKNVIIGIIDTGTDFTHPDFKDSTGGSRILFLWDQRSAASGLSPQPYNYGKQWDKTAIDAGACTHQDNESMGHGTKVAGVAASNGRSAYEYRGMAPDASLISVAVDFNSTGPVIPDAVDYIFHKADSLGLPCVINISLGDYYGSHDGKDLQSQILTGYLNTPGHVIVGAAGNGGNYPFHLQYNLQADTNITFITGDTPNEINFQLYADTADVAQAYYSLSAVNKTNGYTNYSRIDFRQFNASLQTVKYDTLRVNGNPVGYIETYTTPYDNAYELDIYIKTDSTDYLWALEGTGSGKWDSWNFNWQFDNLPTPATFNRMTDYVYPDVDYTVCSSFQCHDSILAIGNYYVRNGFTDVNNAYSPFPGNVDSIAETSSHGPTRDGRIKPDISATGENIVSTGSSVYNGWLIQNYPMVVTQDSLHMIFGGTSAASPATAGAVALYLQKHPQAYSSDVIMHFKNCARRDGYTGTDSNNVYGYGKLDVMNAMICAEPIGISKPNTSKSLQVYPVPGTKESIQITIPENGQLFVYNNVGQCVVNMPCKSGMQNGIFKSLSPGLYLLQFLNAQGETYIGKCIVSQH